MFDPPVGTEIGLLRRLRDQGTQVDLPAVQVKIPPVNAEFPESEFLRKKLIKPFPRSIEKPDLGRVEILRRIGIPQFRIGPCAAEGVAEPSGTIRPKRP